MLRRLRKTAKSLPLLFAFIAIALVAGLGIYLYSRYRHDHSPKTVVTAGTSVASGQTVKSQPAPKSINSSSSSSNSGGATDTHGTSPSDTDSNQWTTSASGVITVKSPAPNTTLKSGDTISGSSSSNEIHYRLSDNKVGVIAQGTLSVDNGNFSGVIHFQPQATSGRLDIFTTNSKGVEYNEVQINVNY